LFKILLFGANGSFMILAMASLRERELTKTWSKRDAILDSQYFSKLPRRAHDMLTTCLYNRSRIDNFDCQEFSQNHIKSECPDHAAAERKDTGSQEVRFQDRRAGFGVLTMLRSGRGGSVAKVRRIEDTTKVFEQKELGGRWWMEIPALWFDERCSSISKIR
jgi:hypothetical protein